MKEDGEHGHSLTYTYCDFFLITYDVSMASLEIAKQDTIQIATLLL